MPEKSYGVCDAPPRRALPASSQGSAALRDSCCAALHNLRSRRRGAWVAALICLRQLLNTVNLGRRHKDQFMRLLPYQLALAAPEWNTATFLSAAPSAQIELGLLRLFMGLGLFLRAGQWPFLDKFGCSKIAQQELYLRYVGQARGSRRPTPSGALAQTVTKQRLRRLRPLPLSAPAPS